MTNEDEIIDQQVACAGCGCMADTVKTRLNNYYIRCDTCQVETIIHPNLTDAYNDWLAYTDEEEEMKEGGDE